MKINLSLRLKNKATLVNMSEGTVVEIMETAL